MFRLRRYRVFVIVAALTTITIYHLTRTGSWEVPDIDKFPTFGLRDKTVTSSPLPLYPLATSPPLLEPQIQTSRFSSARHSTPQSSSVPLQKEPENNVAQTFSSTAHLTPNPMSTTKPLNSFPTLKTEDHAGITEDTEELFGQVGQGRLEVAPRPSNQPRASWVHQQERFPVSTDQTRALPTGDPTLLPRIQHVFGLESESAKIDRLQKLEAVKESFKHAWTGYATWAMPHDELKPQSRGFSDPFNGWGATLVDSLDSLWIMGLTDEFEAAVGNVSRIDFKTSSRKDIPLFETVIRYLGGLVSAYDLTSGQYPVLLDKAVELAEILMGAFDTPNRMPVTYYYWAPSYASQAHRANVHVVLAELGSLAVEFTRLAQITKEDKYYDAIARITDALELWQMSTTVPGLWPIKLDASGCKKPEILSKTATQAAVNDVGDLTWVPVSVDAPMDVSAPVQASRPNDENIGQDDANRPLLKRQADDAAFSRKQDVAAETVDTSKPPPIEKGLELAEPVRVFDIFSGVDCESQGLAHEPHGSWHHYSIGAMADSTYEYLPKEYLLLGGRVDQYRSMYRNAMKPIREKLLYRPMTKQKRDILFMAKADLDKTKPHELKLTYEGTHLGCFAGGMFALGAKVFGIEDDMEIARKLTDGCVWAYESTTTGIMPETFLLAPCDNLKECSWNQTKYYDLLDPHRQRRVDSAEQWNQNQRKIYEEAVAAAQKATERVVDTKVDETGGESPVLPDTRTGRSSVEKRQIGYSESAASDSTIEKEQGGLPTKTAAERLDQPPAPVAAAAVQPVFTPKVAIPHEEFVEARISEERLPEGFTQILSREYKLRPEAIESVFIMYRLTGEQYWRDQGWKMFRAIETHARTLFAHSAISDVTSKIPEHTDTMESFWLAETLKYFYLLFSDPDVISLDDYVLNTEAHPFRMPR